MTIPKSAVCTLLQNIFVRILILGAVVAPASGADVGSSAGQFAVSPSGAATYSMPISVPAGRGGTQPSLSIEYNSQAGGGMLGLGFSLAGLSTISRCPTNQAQDGYKSAVSFDASDKYCLNGQRLVAVSGSYGSPNTEYRTEIESFQKVISYGGSSGNPGYFKVWTKSGLIMDFGATASARFEPPGASGRALSWGLSKVTDNHGQSFDISYTENVSTGIWKPNRIWYANNTSVELAFESRADVRTQYIGGAKTTVATRLKTLETRSEGQAVRQYRFGYRNSGASSTSLLSSVEECAYQNGAWYCLPPTRFDWQLEGASLNLQTLQAPGTGICRDGSGTPGICNDGDNFNSLRYPDINGDGRVDVCYRGDQGVHCQIIGTTGGVAQSISTDICANGSSKYGRCNDSDNYNSINYADFNADGKSDLVFRSDFGFRIFHSSGTSFVEQLNSSLCANNSSSYGVCNDNDNYSTIRYPDINGDGRTDICYRGDQGVRCAITDNYGQIGNTFISTSYCANGTGCDYDTITFSDMDGDGMADLIFRDASGYHVKRFTGSTFGYLFDTTTCPKSNSCKLMAQFPDVNGDGLGDWCYRDSSGIDCYANTGKGITPLIQTSICANGSTAFGGCNGSDNHNTIDFTDFDGDGKSDLIYRSDAGLRFWRSTGSSFSSYGSSSMCANGSPYYGGCNDSNNYDTLHYFDITGDGSANVVYRSDEGLRIMGTNLPRWGKVTKITSGIGAEIDISYKPLSDPDVYSARSGASYPDMDFSAPIPVVAYFEKDDGLGGKNRQSYKYEGLRVSLDGRGMLGFARQTTTNETTGIREIVDYRQDYPFVGMADRAVRKNANGLTLSESETNFKAVTLPYNSNAQTYFIFPEHAVARTWEVNFGTRVVKSEVTQQYYEETPTGSLFLGNLTRSRVTTRAGSENSGAPAFIVETVNQYDNNTSNWHLGRLRRTEVTRSAPNVPSVTRTSAFEYDASTGSLSKEVIEPNTQSYRITTQYQRYATGDIQRKTVLSYGIAARSTDYGYDSGFRFNTSTTNPLGHVVSRNFDPVTGNLLSETGPNGLTSNYQYDAFGRQTFKSFNKDGVYITQSTDRGWCSGNSLCRVGEMYYLHSYDNSGGDAYVFFDVLEREVRQRTRSSDGRYTEQLTEYFTTGRVKSKSKPHFEGDTVVYDGFSYDVLGRLVTKNEPSPSGIRRITRYSYNGLLSTQTVEGQTTQSLSNALGQVERVTDNMGGVVTSSYDAFGNLLQTQDADNNVITMQYDIRGRKTAMTDPSMGHWQYTYDALGQLKSQLDAKGQVTTLEYDQLGRMTRRIEPGNTSNWVYDSRWKGALTSVSNNDYVKEYSYNSFGKPSSATTSIASTSLPGVPSVTTTALSNGRPSSVSSGSPGTELRFSLDVPSGSTNLEFFTYGGTGDADLYVKQGAAPSIDSYDCRSISNSNEDSCTISSGSGKWYVLVRGYSSFSGVKLVGRYFYSGGYSKLLQNGQSVQHLGAASNQQMQFLLDVPFGATQLSITTSGGVGDSQLFVSFNKAPTTAKFDCNDNGAGNTATCDAGTVYTGGLLNLPALPVKLPARNGRYYIVIRGISNFYDVTLRVSFNKLLGGNNATTSSSTNSPMPSPSPLISDILDLNELDLPALLPAAVSSNPLKDLFGAPVEKSRAKSVGANLTSRSMSYQYDNRGRLSKITYPRGVTIEQHYNGNGAINQITNGDSGFTYWYATSWNAWGEVDEYWTGNAKQTSRFLDPDTNALLGIQTGNYGTSDGSVQNLGYSWDKLGRLTQREDYRQNLTETFSYDGLNRLTSNRLYGVPGLASGAELLSLTYSAGGNIQSKSGASYQYAAKPQAVSSAAGVSYSYDANGNMQTAGGRSFTWSAGNQPIRIQEADSTTEFLYGPGRQRIRQTSTSSARAARLNYFFDQLYEEEITLDGTKEKNYINTPLGILAIETRNQYYLTEYLHHDHLGSVDAMTNGAGQVSQRLSFDAFGSRRSAAWEQKSIDTYVTNWGYTGHQQQDDFGLIHMGGRMYDPRLGRFLSADPIIQAPSNTQSYNRYTYVLNNPLALTDPSGYSWFSRIGDELSRWESDFRHEIRRPGSLLGSALQIVGSVASVAFCGPASPGCLAVTNAVVGAGVARAQGASDLDALRDGVISGAAAGASSYINTNFGGVTRVVGHGTVGGLTSVARGNSFGPGFLAAGFSAGAGRAYQFDYATNTAIAAAIGGTAAELSGGKFANGAVTGAFVYAFGEAARRGARAFSGAGGENYGPFTDAEADQLLDRAKGTFRRFLARSDQADLLGQFDAADVVYVGEQAIVEGTMAGAQAFIDSQRIEIYPAGISQGYRGLTFIVGHEFRHLQLVNDALFTRSSFLQAWRFRPGEIDANSWSSNIICQGQGRSGC